MQFRRARFLLSASTTYHGALLHALAGCAVPVPVAAAVEALAYAAEVAAVRCASFGPRAWLDDPALATIMAESTSWRLPKR